MKHRFAHVWTIAALVAAIVVTACQSATQVSVELHTDLPCARVRETAIAVGTPVGTESKAPTGTSTFCDAEGNLGVLVIVPSAGRSEEFGVRAILGVDRDIDACIAGNFAGCVVARRSLRFVPHSSLLLPISMREACIGVACDANATCVRGVCVPARIERPSRCQDDTSCSEDVLLLQAGIDGGRALDASVMDATMEPVDGGNEASIVDTGTGDAKIVIVESDGGDAGTAGSQCVPFSRKCLYCYSFDNGPATTAPCIGECNASGNRYVIVEMCIGQDVCMSDVGCGPQPN